MLHIRKLSDPCADGLSRILILRDFSDIPDGMLSEEEMVYIENRLKASPNEMVTLQKMDVYTFVYLPGHHESTSRRREKIRLAGNKIQGILCREGAGGFLIRGDRFEPADLMACAEGAVLGNYRFDKYKTPGKDTENSLKEIFLVHEELKEEDVEALNIRLRAVEFCRNLVNEPASELNALTLSDRIEAEAITAGVNVEVMRKSRIEALKMGGLLGVNRGSEIPPSFTVLEWKPGHSVRKQPVVLVGKGVTFDTGGMNLKPGVFMDNMKMDMAGAAIVASVILAAARLQLPLHLVALIPSTDNRPGISAIVPGDILTLHGGKTVEVNNTDAEGRLILADALSYASRYNPCLVFTVATLTGSAARAIGRFGIVMMQAKAEEQAIVLKQSGEEVCERIAEFPMWDEYAELLKSDIADLKNTGPAEGGAITAGKFLEAFTDYPFIHLDIAGVSFNETRHDYRGQGGTGTGVRLLLKYLETISNVPS